jgi:kinesin family member 2/24
MAERETKIQVIIRKRPLNSKEIAKGDTDILFKTSSNSLVVREQRLKVDLTKYTEEHSFAFDGVYSEEVSNQDLYTLAVQPIVQAAFSGAKVTCFAYGQTGSGKTYTMMGESSAPGLYLLAGQDLFEYRNASFPNIKLTVSFYEIYCNKLLDLLNDRNKLHVREDAKQNVNIVGLVQKPVESIQSLMHIINQGMEKRTTGQTGANDESSRSHAVLEILLKSNKKNVGKVSFIDLAGSERGADVSGSDSKTRIDGAEINKSLLALKECIRALDQEKKHLPFRGSKLTLVLKDSFIGNCRTVMIGNVSPGLSSCEHTLNTLRYSDRVKELKKGTGKDFSNPLMLPRQNRNIIRYTDESKPMTLLYKKSGEEGKLKSKTLLSPNNGQTSYKELPKEELNQKHANLIQDILEKEDDLISNHQKSLNEMIDVMNYESKLLEDVQEPNSDVDQYLKKLDRVLEYKETVIKDLRARIINIQTALKEEDQFNTFLHSAKQAMDVFDLDNDDFFENIPL